MNRHAEVYKVLQNFWFIFELFVRETLTSWLDIVRSTDGILYLEGTRLVDVCGTAVHEHPQGRPATFVDLARSTH